MSRQDASPQSNSQLQAQILQLQQQVAQLSQILGGSAVAAPRYPMWSLIRDYLRTVGGQGTPINIANGLLKAGHNLGKYPLRNVKITVTSPMMKGLFRIKTDATGVETIILMDHLQVHSERVDRQDAGEGSQAVAGAMSQT